MCVRIGKRKEKLGREERGEMLFLIRKVVDVHFGFEFSARGFVLVSKARRKLKKKNKDLS